MKRAVRAVMTLVGAGLYLWLAVLAGGGAAALFASTPRLAVAIGLLLLLALVALFVGGNLSSGEREDRANRWVLGAFGLIGLLLAYLPAYTDRLDFWTLDADTVRWSGVALFIVGGALRLYPVHVLGRRFSGLVAIQPGHTLVTNGIYGIVRHPSYLGLLINSTGWALAFRSGIGLLLTAVLLVPLLARIRAEEALLRAQFAGEYQHYCRRTWRLLPSIY